MHNYLAIAHYVYEVFAITHLSVKNSDVPKCVKFEHNSLSFLCL